MNNKILLLVLAVLLLGGIFVLANNQNKMDSANQLQTSEITQDTATDGSTSLEDDMVEEENVDEAMEQDETMAVSVTAEGFVPQSVTLKAGQKVVWTNETDATANVSSAPHPTHEEYPPLNLENFEPGTSVELIFEEPGTYKYHDHLNPSKFGTVVVE